MAGVQEETSLDMKALSQQNPELRLLKEFFVFFRERHWAWVGGPGRATIDSVLEDWASTHMKVRTSLKESDRLIRAIRM